MINYKVMKELAVKQIATKEVDIFFNYTKKYLQACLKNNKQEATRMLGKAISILFRLNSLAKKEIGEYFVLKIINPFNEKEKEEIIGSILLEIIKEENLMEKEIKRTIEQTA